MFKYVQQNGGIRTLRRGVKLNKKATSKEATAFINYLKVELGEGHMTAKVVCEVSWHVSQLGHEEFEPPALDPKAKKPGHTAARTIERSFGLQFIWSPLQCSAILLHCVFGLWGCFVVGLPLQQCCVWGYWASCFAAVWGQNHNGQCS